MVNLKESARQWILQNLPYDRGDAVLDNHLRSLDLHALLVAYHNWMGRQIQPKPRIVLKSNSFKGNPLTQSFATELTVIENEIASGGNVTRYLSRGIRHAASLPSQDLVARRDLDLLLNDWGVHHLHLSNSVDADGFVSRTGPLLFAVFRSEKAYFIDIMPHGSWNNTHLLHVLADEWPNDGVIHEIRGIVGLSSSPTDSERAVLRKKAIMSPIEFGGRFFVPGGGMTISGHTIESVRASDNLISKIEKLEKELSSDSQAIRSAFSDIGFSYPQYPSFQFLITDIGPGILETTTSTFIPFD